MEMKYIKSAASVLNRVFGNKGGLDFSKYLLWVSVGQGAVDLQVVKVGGKKKICRLAGLEPPFARTGPIGRFLFRPLFLTARRSAAP